MSEAPFSQKTIDNEDWQGFCEKVTHVYCTVGKQTGKVAVKINTKISQKAQTKP